MKKNLIYLCIFGKPEYVKLFNLFTVSLVLSKSKNFSLLVITSKSLEKQIEPILNVLKATLDIHVMLTEEKNSIFSACLARYEIFEFQKIDEFDKILYLDTDILVAKGLDDLFHEEWDQATIHCLPEGKLEDDRDFYGKTLFKEADYLIPDAGIGYSSGVILFRTSEYVKKLFKRIIELAIKDQNNGREFSCYDQPYLNFLASMDQSIHGARIKKYMVNNPKEQNKIMASKLRIKI
jgi:lipopolysaccharide biosynthesis glycosyltransferase